MKNDLLSLVKWFCRHLTYNDLASAVPILLEVLSGKRSSIPLKPDNDNPPHYRNYRTDTTAPLKPDPPEGAVADWQVLMTHYQREHGKPLKQIRRNGAEPPPGCRCGHCNAPRAYLWLNNGRLATQVRCKICNHTSPTHGKQRKSKAKYCCPHCGKKLSLWKDSATHTSYKCFSYSCPHYLEKKSQLTDEEHSDRSKQKYDPNYKLHYQYREYHIDVEKLKPVRPSAAAPVDLARIHNNHHVVGLVLTFTINFGLSTRLTKNALKGLYGIDISHQTVLNYANASAAKLAPFVDQHSPVPDSTAAADETYIIVEKEWHYTWFSIDANHHAICGHNLSNHRDTESAFALLVDTYGVPGTPLPKDAQLVTDGLPSYDTAVLAYNASVPEGEQALDKRTVIGLENLDPESTEYRAFKQLVERLNRTYKYHTRPRAGFKSFSGAVALTTLFVAYYNFMRPHMALNDQVPVKLDCLNPSMLMPEAWVTLLNQAA